MWWSQEGEDLQPTGLPRLVFINPMCLQSNIGIFLRRKKNCLPTELVLSFIWTPPNTPTSGELCFAGNYSFFPSRLSQMDHLLKLQYNPVLKLFTTFLSNKYIFQKINVYLNDKAIDINQQQEFPGTCPSLLKYSFQTNSSRPCTNIQNYSGHPTGELSPFLLYLHFECILLILYIFAPFRAI